MATTQLTSSGIPGRPYGSFAGKATAEEPVVVTRVVVGGGDFVSWEEHVKAVHQARMLEREIKEQKQELKKVEKKLKTVYKKLPQAKTEGILANLQRLEFKKDEIENKIQALEINLEPLIIALEHFEIEEDDQEFMSMQ